MQILCFCKDIRDQSRSQVFVFKLLSSTALPLKKVACYIIICKKLHFLKSKNVCFYMAAAHYNRNYATRCTISAQL